MHRILTPIITFLLFLNFHAVYAHESRPLFVEIIERAPNTFVVTWKIPPSALNVTSPFVRLPKTCKSSAPAAGTKLIRRQLFRCKNDLSGAEIRVEFPGYNPSISTLFRFQRLSGEKHTTVSSPNDPTWRIPEKEATASVAVEYLVLGTKHILKGYDHLLFVACLVFIAGSWRRILVTITGFTVAHSVTLALAALNLVRVPIPPVEAVIALSIVFLAVEIARKRRDTLTWRYPIAVSGSFGLLHGFGFASVLNEIGLPQTEIPAALLFFNVGVEIGQILFVALLFLAVTGLPMFGVWQGEMKSKSRLFLPDYLIRPAAYLVGVLAVYWTIDRISGFVV